MAEARLKGIIEIDGKKAQASLKSINKQSKNLNKSFLGLGGVAAKLGGAFVGILAVTKITGFLKDAALASNELEVAQRKLFTTFKGVEKKAIEFSEVLQESFQASKVESAKFLSSTQDLLVPLGFARDKAADYSFEVAKLASDIGSFNNLPTTEVLSSIQSALTGVAIGMKKFGVIINETTLKEKGLELGLLDSNGKLNKQNKALVTLKLIADGSTDAIGDLDRNQGTFSDNLKTLSSNVENFMGALGGLITSSPLIGAALNGISSILGLLAEGFDAISDKDPTATMQEGSAKTAIQIENLEKRLKGLSGTVQETVQPIKESSEALDLLSVTQEDVLKSGGDLLKTLGQDMVQSLDGATMSFQQEKGAIVDAEIALDNLNQKLKDQIKTEKELKEAKEAKEKADKEAIERKKQSVLDEEILERQKGFDQELFDFRFDIGEKTTDQFIEELEKRNIALTESMDADKESLENFQLQIEQNENEITELKDKQNKKRKDNAKKSIDDELIQNQRLAVGVSGIFSTLTALNKDASLENFRINQAASIVEATIAGVVSVQNAFKIPPAPNFVLAGLAGAVAATNVGLIASQSPPQFQTDPGQFKVVPGPSNIGVPAIVHGGETIGRGGGGVTINIQGDFLETEESAEKLAGILFNFSKNTGIAIDARI